MKAQLEKAKRFQKNVVIAEGLATSTELMHLYLANMNMDDFDGQLVANILYHNTTLKDIDLSGNRLGPKSAEEFGTVL